MGPLIVWPQEVRYFFRENMSFFVKPDHFLKKWAKSGDFTVFGGGHHGPLIGLVSPPLKSFLQLCNGFMAETGPHRRADPLHFTSSV